MVEIQPGITSYPLKTTDVLDISQLGSFTDLQFAIMMHYKHFLTTTKKKVHFPIPGCMENQIYSNFTITTVLLGSYV